MPTLPSGKAQFSLYVSAELKKRFDEICAEKGYKKQSHLERMLRDWIAREDATAQQSSASAEVHPGHVSPPRKPGRVDRGEKSA